MSHAQQLWMQAIQGLGGQIMLSMPLSQIQEAPCLFRVQWSNQAPAMPGQGLEPPSIFVTGGVITEHVIAHTGETI